MLTVEMTSIPASSSSSTSCQRFSLREPGTLVCASSSTSATARASGRAPRRRPSPRTSLPRYVDRPARDDLEVADLLRGVGPAVGLDEADDDVGAALVGAAALVEHREGLADAGRRTEVDRGASRGAMREEPTGQPSPMAGRARGSARSTFTPLLTEEAERPAVGVVVDERAAPRPTERPRSSATRACLQPGVGDRDVRVEPRARRGHRVDRHLGVVGEPVEPRGRRPPARRPPSRSRGWSGPGSSRAEVRVEVAGSYPSAPVARPTAADWKYCGAARPPCR